MHIRKHRLLEFLKEADEEHKTAVKNKTCLDKKDSLPEETKEMRPSCLVKKCQQSRWKIKLSSSKTLKPKKRVRFMDAPVKSPKKVKSAKLKKTKRMRLITNEMLGLPEKDDIAIGPNGTSISRQFYDSIQWSDPSEATRALLLILFERDELATHSIAKRATPQLNPVMVNDIIYAVRKKSGADEQKVRNIIIKKCHNELAGFKRRQSKRTSL